MRRSKITEGRMKDEARHTVAKDKVEAGKKVDDQNKAVEAVVKNGRHFPCMRRQYGGRIGA